MSKPIRFSTRIRYWNEEKNGGLAVADIPARLVETLGGRRQMRVSGALQGKPFTGSTMMVRGGGFCVGISKAAMRAAGVAVGDNVTIELKAVGKG